VWSPARSRWWWSTHTHTHRHTDTHSETHTLTCTQTHIQRHTLSHTHRHTDTHRHTHRHTHSRTAKWIHTHRDRHTHSCTHRLTHTLTQAHTRRHTYTFMYPDTHTQGHTHTHSCTHRLTHTDTQTDIDRQGCAVPKLPQSGVSQRASFSGLVCTRFYAKGFGECRSEQKVNSFTLKIKSRAKPGRRGETQLELHKPPFPPTHRCRLTGAPCSPQGERGWGGAPLARGRGIRGPGGPLGRKEPRRLGAWRGPWGLQAWEGAGPLLGVGRWDVRPGSRAQGRAAPLFGEFGSQLLPSGSEGPASWSAGLSPEASPGGAEERGRW